MISDTTPAGLCSRARKLATGALVILVSSLLTACTGGGNGSGCVFYGNGVLQPAFDMKSSVGFDNLPTSAAMLGVAIDTDGTDRAIVIAIQYSTVIGITDLNFSPTCDTTVAIDSYTYGVPDTVTQMTFDNNAYLQSAVTNIAGILGMDHNVNILLIVDDNPNPTYYLAVSGTLRVVRDPGGTQLTVTGDLVFVELDGANPMAMVDNNPRILRFENLSIDWDTSVQPM